MRNSEFEIVENGFTQAINKAYRQDETQILQEILPKAHIPSALKFQIQSDAKDLVKKVRQLRLSQGGIDAFLSQYDLSSEEGIVLMCLAESLLRIPDKETVNRLIKDKLSQGDWKSHLGKSHSLFVNAATWALMLTGKLLSNHEALTQEKTLSLLLKRLASKGGEPIIRKSIESAMAILGNQFVLGRTIEEALKRSIKKQSLGYRYSYDMLGESAYTEEDATKYFEAYSDAIQKVGLANEGKGSLLGAGISVKLSALHPRFCMAKRTRLYQELFPRLSDLVLQAKEANINLTIDAEESQTLLITMDLVESLIENGVANQWDGLGLAVQAYQKRAPFLLDQILDISKKHRQKLMIRLVKGAYWDSEIKMSQVQGLLGYPVFTRKVFTDLNYIVCVKKLLEAKWIYPQFATHNALTLATVMALIKEQGVSQYEFQCLHGMGDALYDTVLQQNPNVVCRIYAPVGTHEDLLAYLVRRLLENGANTSFVNRIINENLPVEEIVTFPEDKIVLLKQIPNPLIPLPKDLFFPNRPNSEGLDLSEPSSFLPVLKKIEFYRKKQYLAKPTITDNSLHLEETKRFSPINRTQYLGSVFSADKETVELALSSAQKAYLTWEVIPGTTRIFYFEKMAELLQENRESFYSLLIYEGGKTIEDAVSEVREAIDYCYYYAEQIKMLYCKPQSLQGPTGEINQYYLKGRGIIVCISPWNFPLAIFLGQVLGALAAGNCVIAKPATQTSLIASKAVELLHQAGFPKEVVQLLTGPGGSVGAMLINDFRIQGVVMTGSTETAKDINQKLSQRKGAIIPFIAETGGQNAMIVDSSALPEQVTADVLISAFRSAGQRCSALRVLFLQEEVADKILRMIKGAVRELKIGHPNDIATDIGPVIDEAAKSQLHAHVLKMKDKAKLICELSVPPECEQGSYFAPRIFEISSLELLSQEVFGPILHVVRYKASELIGVIDQINRTGYGLTLGIHSRINETIHFICERAKVGNIYVNRSMIGAVVGVQPFGGEGLSGTGPKAGGPYYLPRLSIERSISINTTASGGNATLMSLKE